MTATNWAQVYRNVAHIEDRDQEPVTITREAARLALIALQERNDRNPFHNYRAAEYELKQVLND